jgi:glyoxylase-like metal-dependent hydrolase (beta-lactamase superfamily II)
LVIGNVTVHRIVDIDPFVLPLKTLFPGAAIDALTPYAGLLGADHIDFNAEAILLALQTYVIQIGGKTILIDTCVGEHKERPARPEWHARTATSYIANLAAAGFALGEIDLVMCTHLHADHVGWNTILQSGRWIPTFPNARYVISQGELDHWSLQGSISRQVNHGCFVDSVQPLLDCDRVTIADAGDAIAEDTRIVALPGHSPGQIGLQVTARSAACLLFCGDALHSPGQVVRPEWSSAFCYDAIAAEQTRRGLLQRGAEEGLVLLPAHLRARAMRVSHRDNGFCPSFI